MTDSSFIAEVRLRLYKVFVRCLKSYDQQNFGPVIDKVFDTQLEWGLLHWIFGTKDTPGVSYPLSPWMAYPFAGYIIGVAAMRYRGLIETKRVRVVSGLVMVAGLPAIAGLFLAQRGAIFFRWGTVSVAFYVVSFAVILLGLVASLALFPRTLGQLVLCLLFVVRWPF